MWVDYFYDFFCVFDDGVCDGCCLIWVMVKDVVDFCWIGYELVYLGGDWGYDFDRDFGKGGFEGVKVLIFELG